MFNNTSFSYGRMLDQSVAYCELFAGRFCCEESSPVGQTGLVLLGPTKASGIKFPSTFYGAAAQEYG